VFGAFFALGTLVCDGFFEVEEVAVDLGGLGVQSVCVAFLRFEERAGEREELVFDLAGDLLFPAGLGLLRRRLRLSCLRPCLCRSLR